MADLLSAGASWLSAQLKANAGATVTYVRDGLAATVTAAVGRSAFEGAGQNGVLERWESRDYLVAAGELPFGEPRRGDSIAETRNGETVVYEVASPRGVPEWHYGDAFRTIVRIHTIQSDSSISYVLTEDDDELTTEGGGLLET